VKKINLRELFPEYELDCFVEVPDADAEAFAAAMTKAEADVYYEFERAENAYQRNRFRNKAHYSLDVDDGIEESVLPQCPEPHEEYERKWELEQLYEAMDNLPEKQAKRVYDRFINGMSWRAIAKAEGVSEGAIRYSIKRALRGMKKSLKNFA